MLLNGVMFTAQVETLLKTKDPSDDATGSSNAMPSMSSTKFSDVPSMTLPSEPAEGIQQLLATTGATNPHMDNMMDNLGSTADETFSWELISLGLEEPLPSQEIINDMYVTSL